MQRALGSAPIPERWMLTRSEAAGLASRALPFILSVISGSTDIIGFLGLNNVLRFRLF